MKILCSYDKNSPSWVCWPEGAAVCGGQNILTKKSSSFLSYDLRYFVIGEVSSF